MSCPAISSKIDQYPRQNPTKRTFDSGSKLAFRKGRLVSLEQTNRAKPQPRFGSCRYAVAFPCRPVLAGALRQHDHPLDIYPSSNRRRRQANSRGCLSERDVRQGPRVSAWPHRPNIKLGAGAGYLSMLGWIRRRGKRQANDSASTGSIMAHHVLEADFAAQTVCDALND